MFGESSWIVRTDFLIRSCENFACNWYTQLELSVKLVKVYKQLFLGWLAHQKSKCGEIRPLVWRVWPLDELQWRLTSLLNNRPPFTALTFIFEALTKPCSHISVSVTRWCVWKVRDCLLTEGGHCALCVSAHRTPHSFPPDGAWCLSGTPA